MAERRLSIIAPEKINGHKRGPNGIYVPTKDNLKKALGRKVIPMSEPINYLTQGNEKTGMGIYRQTGTAVLLIGPTGVGKSMLVRAMAQEWQLPFLYMTCDPDKTEGKMMGRTDMFIATVRDGDEVAAANLQQFRPSNISIAGLSDQPVLLFIDELHKLRRNMDALFYPIINEREVNLTDHLGVGEVYNLHEGTVVVFALNPHYDEGIDRISPAMRQRVATIELEMVTDPDRLMEIVDANLGDLDGKTDIAKSICEMCAGICKVYMEHHKRYSVPATDSQSAEVKNKLGKVLLNLNEAPSPRLVVNTMKAIRAGLDVDDAIRQGIFNPITNDFGATVTALTTIASDVYGIRR